MLSLAPLEQAQHAMIAAEALPPLVKILSTGSAKGQSCVMPKLHCSREDYSARQQKIAIQIIWNGPAQTAISS